MRVPQSEGNLWWQKRNSLKLPNGSTMFPWTLQWVDKTLSPWQANAWKRSRPLKASGFKTRSDNQRAPVQVGNNGWLKVKAQTKRSTLSWKNEWSQTNKYGIETENKPAHRPCFSWFWSISRHHTQKSLVECVELFKAAWASSLNTSPSQVCLTWTNRLCDLNTHEQFG